MHMCVHVYVRVGAKGEKRGPSLSQVSKIDTMHLLLDTTCLHLLLQSGRECSLDGCIR